MPEQPAVMSGGGAPGTPPPTGTAGAPSSSEREPVVSSPPQWEVLDVAGWRHDAAAAYTLFHDDTCNPIADNHFDIIDPELTERGLVASFGAIALDCQSRNLWGQLDVLRSHGHEIVNHSYSHENLTSMSVDLEQEIDEARSILESNLTDSQVTFFIFPFDAFDEGLIQHLRDADYLGTRAGTRGVNERDFLDSFRAAFDVFGPGFSIYAGQEESPCSLVEEGQGVESVSLECQRYVLSRYVEDSLAVGGWGIREFHSVEGEGWEPASRTLYEEHLDNLQQLAENRSLWVATASDVVRYRWAREACPQPVVSGNELRFPAPDAECVRYATELTYIVQSVPETDEQDTEESPQSDARPLELTPLGDDQYLATTNPTGGPVKLKLP